MVGVTLRTGDLGTHNPFHKTTTLILPEGIGHRELIMPISDVSRHTMVYHSALDHSTAGAVIPLGLTEIGGVCYGVA